MGHPLHSQPSQDAGLPAEPSEGKKDLEPSLREEREDAPYRCQWRGCALVPTGEVRKPMAGEHFLDPNFGATTACFDFESLEAPILGHVGEPTAMCKAAAARRSQEGEALPEAPAEGSPSLPSAEAIEKAFRAGYSAGYDAGSVYGPFSEPKPRLTDDEAWSEYAAALSKLEGR